MNLYRMLYLRDGRLVGITYTARDSRHATERAEEWARHLEVELQTVKFLRPVAEQFQLAA